MSLVNYLTRPEYILQPKQIYYRFRRPPSHPVDSFQTIDLPWGVPLQIRPNPDDKVEWSLWIMGIYDLALSESLWRLLDEGETVFDIGANIGYITSLCAAKVGKTGQVIAFEPCPDIYKELFSNVQTWQTLKNWTQIELKTVALTNKTGTGWLRLPIYNRGEAALIDDATDKGEETLKVYEVQLTRLDDLWDNKIDLLKIDIEGHELAALQGAKQLIQEQKIRDIFFEAHHGYAESIIEFLAAANYTVFRLWKGFWKPILYPAHYPEIHPWEPPNYLATTQPQRVQQRLQKRGWQVLRLK
ncbi:FkbM family methyltransferase [Spirulina sp. CS-785/01]|uniref:FkbM family methyltransferase n=1 Tax=Spirulina sp. CS-785/01 TaxID=3021716 RepID=UPI00232F0763|nr:FkbM family methyltransferase [Spirulina sp. CS-785/01]MDB9311754.1 FkbM family methyltransferase [Spirulina sp. CS-785/01]